MTLLSNYTQKKQNELSFYLFGPPRTARNSCCWIGFHLLTRRVLMSCLVWAWSEAIIFSATFIRRCVFATLGTLFASPSPALTCPPASLQVAAKPRDFMAQTVDCFTRPGSVQMVHEDEATVAKGHKIITYTCLYILAYIPFFDGDWLFKSKSSIHHFSVYVFDTPTINKHEVNKQIHTYHTTHNPIKNKSKTLFLLPSKSYLSYSIAAQLFCCGTFSPRPTTARKRHLVSSEWFSFETLEPLPSARRGDF